MQFIKNNSQTTVKLFLFLFFSELEIVSSVSFTKFVLKLNTFNSSLTRYVEIKSSNYFIPGYAISL